jgi:hypothetical protein
MTKQQKRKLQDNFYNETGIEHEDLFKNIVNLNMKETEEYQEIVKNIANEFAELLEKRKQRIEELKPEADKQKALAEA